MKILLYIPACDSHELTHKCLSYLDENTVDKENFAVLVIDNGSDEPYLPSEFDDLDLRVTVTRYKENVGGYVPLAAAYTLSDPGSLIGLLHNDVFIYEKGWDQRVREAFEQDSLLSLVGFCGSGEVCDRGGRGGGTVCNFDGRDGQLQEHTGRRITGLEPAIILDSLAMIFRRETVPLLNLTSDIVPAHFYDKIWSMRLVDCGYHVAVLGIQIDHQGGQTSVINPKYYQSAVNWCESHGIDVESPAEAAREVYLAAEKNMFREFAPKGLIPSRIDAGYNITRMPGLAMWPEGAR